MTMSYNKYFFLIFSPSNVSNSVYYLKTNQKHDSNKMQIFLLIKNLSKDKIINEDKNKKFQFYSNFHREYI